MFLHFGLYCGDITSGYMHVSVRMRDKRLCLPGIRFWFDVGRLVGVTVLVGYLDIRFGIYGEKGSTRGEFA